MPIIDSLVTDRTKTDADRWESLKNKGFGKMTTAEKAEWSSGVKGAYNAADLNRVGAAMAYIAARFREYGYAASVSSRTDWAVGDVPRQTDMNVYLGDLARLRGVLAVLGTTPLTPKSMALLTWATANDIEKILVDVDTLLTNAAHTVDLGWALGIAHTGLYGGIT